MRRPQLLDNYLPRHQHPQQPEEQDSLDDGEMSRETPQPASPGAHRSYELTFKKDQQQRYFAAQPESQPTRALFQHTQTDLAACVGQPLEEYYAKSMEELASLPFADLMSAQLRPSLNEKVGLIGLILQLKRMRIKMRSAGLNIQCLRGKETPSHEDKHRLFLLELLWKQLGKKIFLEALRLNLAHRRYEQHFAEEERREAPRQLQQMGLSEQQSQQESQGLWERQEQSSQEEEVSENIREKLLILVHGISHLLRKALFSSFNKIAQAGSASNPHNSDCESIPLASRPNISQQEEEEEEDDRNYENATPPITYSKLGELESLIENLHEYCAENSDDLLKKYFVKWKISLLEAIANSELHKLRNAQQEEEEEEEEEEERREAQRESRVSRASGVSRESRLTSLVSQAERTLKPQKKALKQLIRGSAIRSFYCKLRGHNELRKIELICLQIRRENTLRKCFQALRLNVQDQQLSRQMAAYYQEAAESQFQDDGTSKLFHKTNLLYCYFKRFKDHRRDNRMARTLSKTMLKLSFRKLLSFGSQEKKYGQLVARKVEHNRKHLLFKCFQAWKHDFLSENHYNAKFRQHMKGKERETLQHCFSILKIEFKRALLRERKAEQLYCSRLKASAFQALKLACEESRELNEKSEQLLRHLRFGRGRQFVGQFVQFYWDYTAYQRFRMKEEKLRRTLLRLHALQGVKAWRKEMLKRQAYSAIETKLVRLRARQRKREIFSAWLGKARAGWGGCGSGRHKEWLVRYYGGLCAVLPS